MRYTNIKLPTPKEINRYKNLCVWPRGNAGRRVKAVEIRAEVYEQGVLAFVFIKEFVRHTVSRNGLVRPLLRP